MRIIAYDELKPIKGIRYSRSQLWRLEKAGKFPRRVPLGPQRHGWADHELDEWLAKQLAGRDGAPEAA